MKKINSDIKNNTFSRFYLLYGSEEYMKNFMKKKIVKALFPDEGENINLNFYSGKNIQPEEVISISDTLPFFADRRLVVITDSGWFKKASAFNDYIANAPETTYFLFVESDVDKKTKLYKYFDSNGYCCEVGVQSMHDLMMTVAASLKKKGLLITSDNCEYFIMKVGTDMAKIQSELDKISSYCYGQKEVTKDDIDEICSEIAEAKIYLMMDAMMQGKSDRALELYYQLLAAHEETRSIFFKLVMNYNNYYQTLLLNKNGNGKREIVQTTGMRDFMVDKFLRLRNQLSIEKLKEIVEDGLDMDRRVKSGDLNDRFAIEFFIVKYSSV